MDWPSVYEGFMEHFFVFYSKEKGEQLKRKVDFVC